MRTSKFGIIPLFSFVILMYLLPVAMFLSRGMHSIVFTEVIYQKGFLYSLLITLLVCLLASGITLFLGTSLALSIAFGNPVYKKIRIFVMLTPILLNPLAIILGWIFLLQNQGPIGLLFGFVHESSILYSSTSVIIGIVYLGIPFVSLPLLNNFQTINKNTIYWSRLANASPRQILKKIIFPLSSRGFITGFVLVFILSIGYYIVPTILGGGNVTFYASLIDQQANQTLNWNMASAMSLLLICLLILLVIVFKLLTNSIKV